MDSGFRLNLGFLTASISRPSRRAFIFPARGPTRDLDGGRVRRGAFGFTVVGLLRYRTLARGKIRLGLHLLVAVRGMRAGPLLEEVVERALIGLAASEGLRLDGELLLAHPGGFQAVVVEV